MPSNPTIDDFWLISGGRYSDFNLHQIGQPQVSSTIKEYGISDLAYYLLNPNPFEIKKRLVGCEVHYLQHKSQKPRKKVWQILPRGINANKNQESDHVDLFIPRIDASLPRIKDRGLESHLNKIYGMLKDYDPVYRGLAKLDQSNVSDVVGICEDIDGNRSQLSLVGNVAQKIDYIGTHMFQPVAVIVKKALIADGLFEMRGFQFSSYDPENRLRLIQFMRRGTRRACVLNPDQTVAYWLPDTSLIRTMHLIEQSLKFTPLLRECFHQCKTGRALPFKLFIKKDMGIHYTDTYLPKVYQEFFTRVDMNPSQKEIILDSLGDSQVGIAFSFLPRSNAVDKKMVTSLSILHDFRALQPLKTVAPDIYTELDNQTSVSEAGKFYLLDAIRGFQNVS